MVDPSSWDLLARLRTEIRDGSEVLRLRGDRFGRYFSVLFYSTIYKYLLIYNG